MQSDAQHYPHSLSDVLFLCLSLPHVVICHSKVMGSAFMQQCSISAILTVAPLNRAGSKTRHLTLVLPFFPPRASSYPIYVTLRPHYDTLPAPPKTPTQASKITFSTSYVNYGFAPPEFNTGVAMLEAGVEPLQAWPIVTRGPDPSPRINKVTSIHAWELNLTSDVTKALVVKTLLQVRVCLGHCRSKV